MGDLPRRSQAMPIPSVRADAAPSRQRSEPLPVVQRSREDSSHPVTSNNLLDGISLYAEGQRKPRDAKFAVNPPNANVRQGEETHSRRDVVTRMLDRITRLLLNPAIKAPQTGQEVKPKDKFAIKTPHLAAVKLGEDIHIAGNSGDKSVRELHQKEGLNRVLALVEQLDHGGSDAARCEKDRSDTEVVVDLKHLPVLHYSVV